MITFYDIIPSNGSFSFNHTHHLERHTVFYRIFSVYSVTVYFKEITFHISYFCSVFQQNLIERFIAADLRRYIGNINGLLYVQLSFISILIFPVIIINTVGNVGRLLSLVDQ